MRLPSRIALAAVAIGAGIAGACSERRMLALWLFSLVEAPRELAEAVPESPSVEWFDDYFTIESIDPQTFAIGEPRYWQQNYSYLILGQRRAVLFDSGPGVRDIVPVVDSLTDLPVTAVASHLHFDHVGNHGRFDRVALVDLPQLRDRADAGALRLRASEHLGFIEEFEAPRLRVSEWWPPGAEIDLGGRRLLVLHTPGHTPESISLFDRERALLFTGDFIYEGPLFAHLPGSDLGEYRGTVGRLLRLLPPETRLLTAHRETPPGAPILAVADLVALRDTLDRVREGVAHGEGTLLESYRVNDRVWLLVEPRWLRAPMERFDAGRP